MVDLGLEFERDIKIIASEYLDFMPESMDKESFVKSLVTTLCNQ